MIEQQFLTFLVERLDAKLQELKAVEEAQKIAVEMMVFTSQLQSVIEQIYANETATPQRTAPRRSTRRGTASELQKTAE